MLSVGCWYGYLGTYVELFRLLREVVQFDLGMEGVMAL